MEARIIINLPKMEIYQEVKLEANYNAVNSNKNAQKCVDTNDMLLTAHWREPGKDLD